MSIGLSSSPKMFADDTSLFSVVFDINASTSDLNNDLKQISNWAHQWKMSFNPDPTKQAQEVIFSRKKISLIIQKFILIIVLLLSLPLKSILV